MLTPTELILGDGMEVLFNGSKTLRKSRTVVQIMIVSHARHRCCELIAYCTLESEAPRLYVNTLLLANAISIEIVQQKLMCAKELCAKLGKDFDYASASRSIFHELMVRHLLSHLCFNGIDPTGAMCDYTSIERLGFSITLGKHELYLLLEQPMRMQPVCVSRRITKEASRNVMVAPAIADEVSTGATVVKIFASLLTTPTSTSPSSSSTSPTTHKSPHGRWRWAIRRVLFCNAVVRTRLRLLQLRWLERPDDASSSTIDTSTATDVEFDAVVDIGAVVVSPYADSPSSIGGGGVGGVDAPSRPSLHLLTLQSPDAVRYSDPTVCDSDSDISSRRTRLLARIKRNTIDNSDIQDNVPTPYAPRGRWQGQRQGQRNASCSELSAGVRVRVAEESCPAESSQTQIPGLSTEMGCLSGSSTPAPAASAGMEDRRSSSNKESRRNHSSKNTRSMERESARTDRLSLPALQSIPSPQRRSIISSSSSSTKANSNTNAINIGGVSATSLDSPTSTSSLSTPMRVARLLALAELQAAETAAAIRSVAEPTAARQRQAQGQREGYRCDDKNGRNRRCVPGGLLKQLGMTPLPYMQIDCIDSTVRSSISESGSGDSRKKSNPTSGITLLTPIAECTSPLSPCRSPCQQQHQEIAPISVRRRRTRM
mmetsp:Transcript_30015/g.61797  ORF Transcript_30015/g.61797 Transcript_30015/m.61797 type:complete len:656 (-) Transcript_30015:169-2136(-)